MKAGLHCTMLDAILNPQYLVWALGMRAHYSQRSWTLAYDAKCAYEHSYAWTDADIERSQCCALLSNEVDFSLRMWTIIWLRLMFTQSGCSYLNLNLLFLIIKLYCLFEGPSLIYARFYTLDESIYITYSGSHARCTHTQGIHKTT